MPLHPVRNFAVVFVQQTKKLCRTITKHQGVFLVLVDEVVTDPGDRATVHAMLAAIQAGCAVLDRAFPNIPV